MLASGKLRNAGTVELMTTRAKTVSNVQRRDDAGKKTPPKRRSRGRPAAGSVPAASDDEILEAAFNDFAQFGYVHASLRHLGHAVGVSPTYICLRFGSKEKLWYRALEREIRGPRSIVFEVFDQSFPNDTARLRQLILGWTKMAAEKPGIPRLINNESETESRRLKFLHRKVIAPFYALFDPLLQRVAQEHGVEPPDSVMLMHLLVDGVSRFFATRPLIRRLRQTSAMESENVEAYAERFADFFLRSMRCSQ